MDHSLRLPGTDYSKIKQCFLCSREKKKALERDLLTVRHRAQLSLLQLKTPSSQNVLF